MAELKPLRKQIEELKDSLDEWKNELNGIEDPGVKQVLKEISKYVSEWDSYGLGKQIKSAGGWLG